MGSNIYCGLELAIAHVSIGSEGGIWVYSQFFIWVKIHKKTLIPAYVINLCLLFPN